MAFNSKIVLGLVILSGICGSLKAETPIRKCDSEKTLPLMVQIDNCSKLPCELVRGTRTHMAIQFVAPKNSMSEISAKLRLTTLGVEIPFELVEERSDVCRNLMLDAYCPLDAGEDVTYHLVWDVSQQQPELPTKVEVNLIDKTDATTVACFVTDVRIKPRF